MSFEAIPNDTSLEDKPKSGRSSVVVFIEIVEQQPIISAYVV